MRTTPVILNAIVATFSIAFFLYTFVAVKHLEGLARDFVTDKTIGYSAPVIDAVEKSLESPLAGKLLTASQEGSVRREIDSYKSDPIAFVHGLTGASEKPKRLLPALSGMESFKNKIRVYYDGTLAALIADLRIFAGSNAVAACLALVLALRSPKRIKKHAVWFSFLLFAGVLYSSFLYVDGMSFFTIMFRLHMGWWYPVSLALVVAKLFMEYSRAPVEPEDPIGSAALSARARSPRARPFPAGCGPGGCAP